MFSLSASRPSRHHHRIRASFLHVALLVVCAMLTHSLDFCASHLGLPPAAVPHSAVPHSAAAEAAAPARACHQAEAVLCERCPQQHPPHSDGCDPASEIAVRTASGQAAQNLDAIAVPCTAPAPQAPVTQPLSGWLPARAEPPPAPFLTAVCRQSLPDRAPPVTA